jgi:hypothetical protein
MRLGRLAARQYYLPLRVGKDAVLPVVDLNPRIGIVFTPRKLTEQNVVTTIRFLEPEGRRGEEIYTGDPITLALKDADIKDVLKTFSVLVGIDIVLDPTVRGQVTLELREVPWDQALDVVLRTNDLGLETDGEIWYVAPLDELSRRKRVRTEATVNLPRGGGSATIASRGDEVNRTVVVVVESVAGEPELVAERDGLLNPPDFALVASSEYSETPKGNVLVFRGTATAEGELRDVDLLGNSDSSKAAALREACRMARPWTVLDERVRRIEAVVGYGLRVTPPPPALEPVHVAVAGKIGIELDVEPAPTKLAGGRPGMYVASAFIRDLDTMEVISAPRITVRKGDEATIRSSIPRADGEPWLLEMKLLIADDRSKVSYSWTITQGSEIVSSQSAEFGL